MAKGQLPLTNPPDWVCTLLFFLALFLVIAKENEFSFSKSTKITDF